MLPLHQGSACARRQFAASVCSAEKPQGQSSSSTRKPMTAAEWAQPVKELLAWGHDAWPSLPWQKPIATTEATSERGVKIDVSIQPCWFRSQIQEIFKMCKAHDQGN